MPPPIAQNDQHQVPGYPKKKYLRQAIECLNEQQKNIVLLAKYSRRIVVLSFTFLLLGALMKSIIPCYYLECMQVVAMLNPDPAKVVQALAGIGITTALGALLTAGWGALFWIAGSRANYNMLHYNFLLKEAAFFRVLACLWAVFFALGLRQYFSSCPSCQIPRPV